MKTLYYRIFGIFLFILLVPIAIFNPIGRPGTLESSLTIFVVIFVAIHTLSVIFISASCLFIKEKNINKFTKSSVTTIIIAIILLILGIWMGLNYPFEGDWGDIEFVVLTLFVYLILEAISAILMIIGLLKKK